MSNSVPLPPTTASAPPIAFVDVTVLAMNGTGPQPHRTVLVERGRIAAVGPAAEVRVDPNTPVIDGAGKFLLPGLCDMHVHIAAGDLTTPDLGLTEAETLQRFREYVGVFLDHGVTTVRNMAGIPLHLQLRAEIAAGRTRGPRIFTTGPILETRFTWPGLSAIGRLVTSPEQARETVREIRRDGYDFTKVYNDIDADIYDALVAESRAQGIMIVGHVPFAKGLEGALAARQDSIEHLRSYDFAADTRTPPGAARFEGWLHSTPTRLRELAERTAAAGVCNVPTLAVENAYVLDGAGAAAPEVAGLPDWLGAEVLRMHARQDESGLFTPAQRRTIRAGTPVRMAMVKALDEAGAGLLPGSDCPIWGLVPGRSLLRELELMVACGLSPARVLECATSRAAGCLGIGDQVGTVEPGKVADLVLLDSDPSADIGAIHRQAGVMAAGVWSASGVQRATQAAIQ